MRDVHTLQMELDHIAAMISQLKLLHSACATSPSTVVTRPHYWRERINAILEAEGLPPSMTEKASALLARIEELDRHSANPERHEPPSRVAQRNDRAG